MDGIIEDAECRTSDNVRCRIGGSLRELSRVALHEPRPTLDGLVGAPNSADLTDFRPRRGSRRWPNARIDGFDQVREPQVSLVAGGAAIVTSNEGAH